MRFVTHRIHGHPIHIRLAETPGKLESKSGETVPLRQVHPRHRDAIMHKIADQQHREMVKCDTKGSISKICARRTPMPQHPGLYYYVLPPNRVIYHGERVRELHRRCVMYWSNRAMASMYAEYRLDTIVTVEPYKLLDITNEATLHMLYAGFGKKDRRALVRLTGYDPNKTRQELVIHTEGFLDKLDEKKGNYISMRVARAICKLKFDGWIIPVGHFRKSGRPFHEEVMMCTCNKAAFKSMIKLSK